MHLSVLEPRIYQAPLIHSSESLWHPPEVIPYSSSICPPLNGIPIGFHLNTYISGILLLNEVNIFFIE